MTMSNKPQQSQKNVDQGRPAMLALLQKGQVDAADITTLRREIFCDRSLSRIEIEDLFGVDAVVRPNHDAWVEFFVEVVTDHLVWDLRPTGIINEAQARWVIEKVDASRTAASFALLVNILDEAHQVPLWFAGAVRARAVANWPGLRASWDAGSAHLA